jgi:hypothetical protein
MGPIPRGARAEFARDALRFVSSLVRPPRRPRPGAAERRPHDPLTAPTCAHRSLSKKNDLVTKLLAEYEPSYPIPTSPAKDFTLLEQGMVLILMRHMTQAQAETSVRALRQAYPDYNETRVSQHQEISACFRTSTRKKGFERLAEYKAAASDLKDFLQEVFQQTHGMELEFLREDVADGSKPMYEMKLLGLTSASYLMWLAQGEQVPVNPALAKVLDRLALIPRTSSMKKAAASIEEIVPKGESLQFTLAFHEVAEHWNDEENPSYVRFKAVKESPVGSKAAKEREQAMARAESQRQREEERIRREEERERKRLEAEEKKRQREEERLRKKAEAEQKKKEAAEAKKRAAEQQKREAEAKKKADEAAKKKAAEEKVKAEAKRKADAKKQAAAEKKKAEVAKKAEAAKLKAEAKKKADAAKKAEAAKKAAAKKAAAKKKAVANKPTAKKTSSKGASSKKAAVKQSAGAKSVAKKAAKKTASKAAAKKTTKKAAKKVAKKAAKKTAKKAPSKTTQRR